MNSIPTIWGRLPVSPITRAKVRHYYPPKNEPRKTTYKIIAVDGHHVIAEVMIEKNSHSLVEGLRLVAVKPTERDAELYVRKLMTHGDDDDQTFGDIE